MKLKMISQEVFGIYSKLNEKKAIIVSLKSFQLSRNERILLSKEKP